MKTHLPIDLLRPFRIDLQKIKHYDQLLTKGVEENPISRDALNALRILVVTTFSQQTSNKNKNFLLKLCDEFITKSSQRFTGIFLYNDAKNMISRYIDFPIEL